MSIGQATNGTTLDRDDSAEASAPWDAGSERLPLDEAIEFKQLEGVIEQGMRHFVEVGNALATIRNKRLYRGNYKAFSDYCDERWELSRTHVDRLIAGATVAQNLTPIGVTLANESQARVLSGLAPEEQREVVKRAIDANPDGNLTAVRLSEVVRQFQGEPSSPPTPPSWTLDDAVEHLGSRLYDISQRWPREHLAVMADQLRCLADELATYGELRS